MAASSLWLCQQAGCRVQAALNLRVVAGCNRSVEKGGGGQTLARPGARRVVRVPLPLCRVCGQYQSCRAGDARHRRG